MWPFRRTPVLPTVTPNVYARWLRAWQPPWSWFVVLSEVEQEGLARIGDERMQDVALAIGWAVKDPDLADAGLKSEAGDGSGEETILRRLTAGLVDAITKRRPAPAATPSEEPAPPTMGGIGERQTVETKTNAEPRVLFGKVAGG